MPCRVPDDENTGDGVRIPCDVFVIGRRLSVPFAGSSSHEGDAYSATVKAVRRLLTIRHS